MSKHINYQSIFALAILYVLSLGCSYPHRVRADQVTQIRVWAKPKGMETPRALDWRDVKREGRDSLIIDRAFIDSFVVLMNHLHPCAEDYVSDKRCVVELELDSGESIVVALGERFGIHIDGKPMQNDNRMISFIDRHLYEPHAWDYWLPDDWRERDRLAREYMMGLDAQE